MVDWLKDILSPLPWVDLISIIAIIFLAYVAYDTYKNWPRGG